jgi:Putative peptidoglycan binding domain
VNWYLNRFLTSWRDAVNEKFPHRTTASEGTIGDVRHQAETFSQHNPDKDGSVDAWDMDVNLHGAPNDEGDTEELAAVEELKAAFQRQPGAQLWIHRGQIANKDIAGWSRRHYSGINKHMKHVHWQSDADGERKLMVGRLNDDVVDAINAPTRTESVKGPPWPHETDTWFSIADVGRYRQTVYRAQSRLRVRGWRITVDGYYGPRTERIVRQFQAEKGLDVDGLLGRATWRTLWVAPITD